MDRTKDSVTVVGATTSGTVLLNCAQEALVSTMMAAATRIGKDLAAFGPTLGRFPSLRLGDVERCSAHWRRSGYATIFVIRSGGQNHIAIFQRGQFLRQFFE